MKSFFTTLLAILCGMILIWGNIHWNNKTSVIADETTGTIPKVESKSGRADINSKKEVNHSMDLLSYTKNWPAEASELFRKAQAEGHPFHILIAGSNALGDDPEGWAYRTKAGLIEAFGNNNITVTISEYETTSLQFVENNYQEELAQLNSDMVILEPFTLNDNGGYVASENSHINIQMIIDRIKEVSPETVVILQPPNPLYNAKYYPIQVANLKEYAEQNNIPYLDHWTVWPDPDSEDVEGYLSSGQPNNKGHELWSEYILDYLISK